MSVRRGIATATLGNMVPPLSALITAPLLAQGLGVVGRGEVAAATAPLILATTILTFGIPESFTYFVSRRLLHFRQHLVPGLALLLVVGLLGSGLIAIVAVPLSGDDPGLTQLILVGTTCLIPALLMAGLRGVASGRQLWRRIAFERSLGAILRMLGILALFLSDQLTPLTGTIVLAASTFVGGVVYLIPPVATRTFLIGQDRDGDAQVRLISYGSRIWLGSLAGVLLMRLDQLLMTPLSSVAELGLYAVAASISELILVFNSAVRDVLFAAESRKPNADRIGQAARLSTVATVMLGAGVAAISPWAIPFFFGADFSGAVLVTIVLVIAVVLGNPGSIAGAGLSARGRPELRSASIVAGLVINVVVLALLVPTTGALGAAIATVAGNFVSGNLNVFWMKRFFGVPPGSFYLLKAQDFDFVRQMLGRRQSRRS